MTQSVATAVSAMTQVAAFGADGASACETTGSCVNDNSGAAP